MSRTIAISTSTFASIWASRQNGEETEDAILRRILGCDAGNGEDVGEGIEDGGVFDKRNNVHFPEGFEVFRTYKRKEYKAIAQSGTWVREDTGERFPNLSQLNQSIVAGNENVWNGNWKYRMSDDSFGPIDRLRH